MPSSTTINPGLRSDPLAAQSASSRRSQSDNETGDSSFEQVLQTQSKQDVDEQGDQKDADRAEKSSPKKRTAKVSKTRKPDDAEDESAVKANQRTTAQAKPAESNVADEASDADAANALEAAEKADAKTKAIAPPTKDPLDGSLAASAAAAQSRDVQATDSDHPAEKTGANKQQPIDAAQAKARTAAAPVAPQIEHADKADPTDATEESSGDSEKTETAETQAAPAQPKAGKTTKSDAASTKTAVRSTVSPLVATPLQQKSGNQSKSRDENGAGNIPIDPQLIDDSDETDADSDFSFLAEQSGGPEKKTSPAADDLNLAGGSLIADGSVHQLAQHATATPASPTPTSPELRFAEANHQQVVTAVQGHLLPNGGTMTIRLDPPELGDLQLLVHMRDGVMSAAFQTSNDQATHLLSHSLGDLRTALEASGISVDRLHVEQAPKDQHARNDNPESRQQQSQTQDSPARRDQQRRELIEKMWKKLNGEDLDLVA